MLDTSVERVSTDAPDTVSTAYGFCCNAWPEVPGWKFVAVGLEHEDVERGRAGGA